MTTTAQRHDAPIEARSLGGPLVTGAPRRMRPAGRRCSCGNLLSRWNPNDECHACIAWWEWAISATITVWVPVAESVFARRRRETLDVLPATARQVEDRLGLKHSAADRRCAQLLAAGHVVRSGRGVRSDPYVYHRVTDGHEGDG